MELSQLSTNADFGFVDGIVDHAITEQQRAEGMVGHTVEEWEAYSNPDGGATAHPLRDEHEEVVGHLLRTYVDRHGRLCASARIDMDRPGGKELFERVKRREKHSFSIGYDAIPQKGTPRYKNARMDVSLTTEPRKEFATIQVRCNKKMSGTEGDAAAQPPAAQPEQQPAPTQPEPPTDPLMQLSKMSPEEMAKASAEALIRERAMAEQLASAQEAARKWQEHQEAQRKKMQDDHMAKMLAAREVFAAHGFDPESEAQKPIAAALASSEHSSPLVVAMEGVSAENMQLKRKLQEMEDAIKRSEAAKEEASQAQRRDAGLLEILRQYNIPAADKRVPRANPTNEMTAANILGLDKLQPSLFQQAAQNAQVQNAAAAQAASTPSTASSSSSLLSTPPAAAEPQTEMIEMPEDATARLNLAFKCDQHKVQMPQAVRCSKGQEGFVRPSVEKVLRERPTASGGDLCMTDAQMQFFLGDTSHWNSQADKLPHNAWARDAKGNTRDFSHMARSQLTGTSSLWSVNL